MTTTPDPDTGRRTRIITFALEVDEAIAMETFHAGGEPFTRLDVLMGDIHEALIAVTNTTRSRPMRPEIATVPEARLHG